MPKAFEKISVVRRQAEDALSQVKQLNLKPDGQRSLGAYLPIKRVEELTGKTRGSISYAEELDVISQRPRNPRTNRKENFSLTQVRLLQDHFGTSPRRDEGDFLVKIAVQNFKGGVGKSTQACALAHYLSEKGYRVLLIDQDPQGSTTATFGLLPDQDLTQDETLYPYYCGVFEDGRSCDSIRYAIRPTHWDGLDLIPSNMSFGHAEYDLATSLTKPGEKPLELLKDSLSEIDADYDVVVIDSPPALNFIALNVLKAANAYIIPAPPGLYDFMSTCQFLRMLEDMYKAKVFNQNEELLFLKILATRVESNEVHNTILNIMRTSFAENLMSAVVPASQYVREASNLMTTIYEMPSLPIPDEVDGKKGKPVTSMRGYKSARHAMDLVNGEIENAIKAQRVVFINKLIREAQS